MNTTTGAVPALEKGKGQRSRLLLIIALGENRLRDYLRDAFCDMPGVEVIVDRRVHSRRIDSAYFEGQERRRAGRRERVDIDEQLRRIGWASVVAPITFGRPN